MPKDRNEPRGHLDLHPRPFDKLRVQPVQVVEWCFDKLNKLYPRACFSKEKGPGFNTGAFSRLGVTETDGVYDWVNSAVTLASPPASTVTVCIDSPRVSCQILS